MSKDNTTRQMSEGQHRSQCDSLVDI
jgi:hypothetical protein